MKQVVVGYVPCYACCEPARPCLNLSECEGLLAGFALNGTLARRISPIAFSCKRLWVHALPLGRDLTRIQLNQVVYIAKGLLRTPGRTKYKTCKLQPSEPPSYAELRAAGGSTQHQPPEVRRFLTAARVYHRSNKCSLELPHWCLVILTLRIGSHPWEWSII